MSVTAAIAARFPPTAEAQFAAVELAWLEAAITARLAAFGQGRPAELPSPPPIEDAVGAYAELVVSLVLDPAERLMLALALAPHVAPAILDPFLLVNEATGRRFTEFGGVAGQNHGGFLPSAETAMFLIAGDDRPLRVAVDPLFAASHPLVRRGILLLDHRHPEEPALSAALRLSASGLHLLLRGDENAPPGPDFPASIISTNLDWADLILAPATQRQIEIIGLWIAHAPTLMVDWGLSRRLKPGYRCLFYGSPGTGKTLTACLLGKRHGLPVYRVDTARLVSKWIGETEKNLAALFDQAESRRWILFFDEADALFGKRTESNSANDRAANQQIAYLLQRLEDYSGPAILATNQQAFLDEAFARRFQSAIRFPMPDAAARERLWQEAFASNGFALAPDVDFKALAARYEIAGGSIVNVLRHASLMAVERQPPVVQAHDLIDGIRQELQKDGRHVT